MSADSLVRSASRDVTVGLALTVGPLAASVSVGNVAALALYLAVAALAVAGLDFHRPQLEFGWANRVTLLRAVMTCALAGAAIDGELGVRGMWIATAIAALALALDGVDGWLARRFGTSSPYGARFDMEVDAFSIVVLTALLWRHDKVGAWVLLAGALRYAFVAAGWLWPKLNAPLPPRERRRAICAILIAGLVAAMAPVVPSWLAASVAWALLARVALTHTRS